MKTLDLFNQNIAEISITYSHKIKPADRIKICGSKEAYDQFLPLFADVLEHHEKFLIILLNRSNQMIGYYKVSEGGTAGTVVDPKLVFQAAIKANASSILLSHNHPSGTCQPSEADLRITKKLKEGGAFLDIQVLDHIIISSDKYYSFADQGMI